METWRTISQFPQAQAIGGRRMLFVGAAAILLWAGCGKKDGAAGPGGAAKAPPPTEVDVVVVKPTYLEKSAEVNGSVIASEFAELRPEVAGRLVHLDVREGAQVKAGTVIARLFNDDLQAQLQRHDAQLKLAETTRDRLSKLLAVDGINKQEFDQAEAQVASIQADRAFTEAQLRKTIVTAPFTGTLGLRNVSNGAYITPSNIIATIQQTDALKIDFNVPENLAALIKVGHKVKVLVEGVPDTLGGTISAIEPQLNLQNRSLKVRALIANAGSIAPGGFAKVYVDAGSTSSALLIPTNAIVADTRFKRVYVIKGGKAALTTVQTGYRLQDRVEIVSGLQPGDSVAISGILYLRPDAAVKVRSVKP